MVEYLGQQYDLYRAEVQARLRKLLGSNESGAGGQSLETLVLLAGGVVAAVGLVAFLVIKITEKEGTVAP
jgi:hypothetical protein